MLPNAARLYREQIAAALAGDRDEGERARELLRNEVLLGGEIRLVPDGAALYAEFALQRRVMLAPSGEIRRANQGVKTAGSGGRI